MAPPRPPPSPAAPPRPPPPAALSAGAIGGIIAAVVVVILLLVCFLAYRRHVKANAPPKDVDVSATSVTVEVSSAGEDDAAEAPVAAEQD